MTTIRRLAPIPVLAVALALPGSAQAEVDMKDLAYVETARDLPGAFQIVRVYSSRSDAAGAFGFGWCAEFEAALEPIGGGAFRLLECGEEAARLDRQSLRRKPGDGIERARPDGRRQGFARDGSSWNSRWNLQWYDDPTGRRIEVRRDELGRAVWLARGSEAIELRYAESSDLVLTAARSDGALVRYSYSDGLLTAVMDGAAFAWRYAYDEMKNLALSRGPGGGSRAISYDGAADRVASVRGSDGCVETYRLAAADAPATGRFATLAERRCDGALAARERHEFRVRASGEIDSTTVM